MEDDKTRYVILKDQWGNDPRFVRGFEFTRADVPEHWEFESGLRKGTFAPVDVPNDEPEVTNSEPTEPPVTNSEPEPVLTDSEVVAEDEEEAEPEHRHKKHRD
jgi:hypothetical protein